MGLKVPRGKYERLDVLLSAQIWRTLDRVDPTIGASCRNISARGCRLQIEDARLVPGFDLDSSLEFSIQLSAEQKEVGGSGKIAWLKKERGMAGKTRLVLGVEFTAVSTRDRERIKAFILKSVRSSE